METAFKHEQVAKGRSRGQHMSLTSKFVTAVIGLFVMAVVASRQLFLFVVLDSQGGSLHLWLAVSASVASCIAGALMFYFFVRSQRTMRSKLESVASGRLPIASSDGLFNNSVTPMQFDAIRWARLNPWLSEGQANDRTPMNGAVVESGGSASEQRAFARRSHQIMFKKWSQERHD
jgi:hypothetical protein